jgi:hypothetical protein
MSRTEVRDAPAAGVSYPCADLGTSTTWPFFPQSGVRQTKRPYTPSLR